MKASESRKNAGRTRGRPFAPGNPGRPKGAKHKTTLLLQSMIDADAEAIIKKLIALARKGNLLAIKLVVERLLPVRREAPVSVNLPHVEATSGIPKLTGAILDAVSKGEIEPGAAATLASLVSGHAKALEFAELERRVSALEGRENDP